MKTIPLHSLKPRLASYAKLASEGEEIEITRYEQPYARLVPIGESVAVLHVGTHVGRQNMTPVVSKPLQRGYLMKLMRQDRSDRS